MEQLTYHMPNIPRCDAQIYANQGVRMVAQHKSLPDGICAGMGWIISISIRKAQLLMKHQKYFARIHQQQQLYHPQQPHLQQYCGWGRNTQQQQPQFGENMSRHQQGWL